jgi:hypothetical protein
MTKYAKQFLPHRFFQPFHLHGKGRWCSAYAVCRAVKTAAFGKGNKTAQKVGIHGCVLTVGAFYTTLSEIGQK